MDVDQCVAIYISLSACDIACNAGEPMKAWRPGVGIVNVLPSVTNEPLWFRRVCL